jgi:hypothetical protein
MLKLMVRVSGFEIVTLAPRESYDYKPNMCGDCPHRAANDPSVREMLDSLYNGATIPHTCHNDDGHYCAGHMIELGIRYEKQI